MALKCAGIPTGSVQCVLQVPSLNLHREFSTHFPERMSTLRGFLQKWIPVSEEAREGARFTLRARVRHRNNQGYRYIVLCRWRAGESINHALEDAYVSWKQLEERKKLLLQSWKPDRSDVTLADRIEIVCGALFDD
jgi:hypothetical protein